MPDDEIEVRMRAELAALENRKPEIISRERSLDDARLEKHQAMIRSVREASLRHWEYPKVPERPAPKLHPMVERLAAKQREEISLGEMIGHVIAAERAGRVVVAGLGLIQLKLRHAAAMPSELADAERTWPGLVAAHFPFGLARVEALMGPLLHRSGTMACSVCGTEQVCLCGCGRPYIPQGPWPDAPPQEPQTLSALARAQAAVRDSPGKSDRALAAAIGVGRTTIARARKSLKK